MAREDRRLHLFLLFFDALLYATTLGVSAYSVTQSILANSTVFSNSSYDLDVKPAYWAVDGMWIISYLFQAALVIYSLVNIFRATPGGFLYFNPDIVPVRFLMAYLCNWICNCSWIAVATRAKADQSFLPISAAWLWVLFIFLAAALYYSYRALDVSKKALIKFGLTGDIYTVIVLFHNGISIYATWIAVASSLNAGLALVYVGDIEQQTVGTIVLTINATYLVAYACLDIFAWDRYTRYVFGPHCAFIFTLSGIVANMGISSDINSIFALILLIFGGAFLIAKIVITIVRAKNQNRHFHMKPLIEENNFLKLPLP